MEKKPIVRLTDIERELRVDLELERVGQGRLLRCIQPHCEQTIRDDAEIGSPAQELTWLALSASPVTVGFYCHGAGAIIQCDDRGDDFGDHGFMRSNSRLAMRLPRMTTRRWLFAVAALGATLGGHREAIRLKQKRDEFLERAAWHAAGETYYRDMIASSNRSVLYKTTAAEDAAVGESIPVAPKENAFERTLALWFDLPDRKNSQAAAADLEQLRNERARAAAMAIRRQRIIDDYIRSHVVYHQQLAEHHAALARKYEYFAAHPWSPVTADPPWPK